MLTPTDEVKGMLMDNWARLAAKFIGLSSTSLITTESCESWPNHRAQRLKFRVAQEHDVSRAILWAEQRAMLRHTR